MKYIEGFEMWKGYPISGLSTPTETVGTSQLLENYNVWVKQDTEA